MFDLFLTITLIAVTGFGITERVTTETPTPPTATRKVTDAATDPVRISIGTREGRQPLPEALDWDVRKKRVTPSIGAFMNKFGPPKTTFGAGKNLTLPVRVPITTTTTNPRTTQPIVRYSLVVNRAKNGTGTNNHPQTVTEIYYRHVPVSWSWIWKRRPGGDDSQNNFSRAGEDYFNLTGTQVFDEYFDDSKYNLIEGLSDHYPSDSLTFYLNESQRKAPPARPTPVSPPLAPKAKSGDGSTKDNSIEFNVTASGDEDVKPYKLWQAVIIIVLTVVTSAVTIVGNLLVLFSFAFERTLRQPTNYYIVSLAVSDLIIGFSSMPFYTLYLLLGYWPLGEILCDLWLSTDYTVCLASQYTVFFITLDRFCSVKIPTKYRQWRTPFKVRFMIYCAWIIPVSIFFIAIFGWKYFFGSRGVEPNQCYVPFRDDRVFNTALIFFYYWSMLVILLSLYAGIYKVAYDLAQKSIEKEKRAKAVAKNASGAKTFSTLANNNQNQFVHRGTNNEVDKNGTLHKNLGIGIGQRLITEDEKNENLFLAKTPNALKKGEKGVDDRTTSFSKLDSDDTSKEAKQRRHDSKNGKNNKLMQNQIDNPINRYPSSKNSEQDKSSSISLPSDSSDNQNVSNNDKTGSQEKRLNIIRFAKKNIKKLSPDMKLSKAKKIVKTKETWKDREVQSVYAVSSNVRYAIPKPSTLSLKKLSQPDSAALKLPETLGALGSLARQSTDIALNKALLNYHDDDDEGDFGPSTEASPAAALQASRGSVVKMLETHTQTNLSFPPLLFTTATKLLYELAADQAHKLLEMSTPLRNWNIFITTDTPTLTDDNECITEIPYEGNFTALPLNFQPPVPKNESCHANDNGSESDVALISTSFVETPSVHSNLTQLTPLTPFLVKGVTDFNRVLEVKHVPAAAVIANTCKRSGLTQPEFSLNSSNAKDSAYFSSTPISGSHPDKAGSCLLNMKTCDDNNLISDHSCTCETKKAVESKKNISRMSHKGTFKSRLNFMASIRNKSHVANNKLVGDYQQAKNNGTGCQVDKLKPAKVKSKRTSSLFSSFSCEASNASNNAVAVINVDDPDPKRHRQLTLDEAQNATKGLGPEIPNLSVDRNPAFKSVHQKTVDPSSAMLTVVGDDNRGADDTRLLTEEDNDGPPMGSGPGKIMMKKRNIVNGFRTASNAIAHGFRKSRLRRVTRGGGSSDRKKSRSENRARKALRTITCIMGAFVLCWTPYHICETIRGFSPDFPINPHFYSFTYWLCYLNSPLNPFMYALANQQFKQTFLKILKCEFKRS